MTKIVFSLICLLPLLLTANEDLYPTIPRCDIFRIKTITRLGQYSHLPVFQNRCPEFNLGQSGMLASDETLLQKHRGRSMSWTSFDLKSPITVEVKIIRPKKVPFSKEVKISPQDQNIVPKISGGLMRFTISQAGQYLVEIGKAANKHILFIFVNPPEKDQPAAADKSYLRISTADQASLKTIATQYSGLYFKKGLHNIGSYQVPKHINNIYLEDGAWIEGQLKFSHSADIKIFGRGVLSNRNSAYHSSKAIDINAAQKVSIEGITLTDIKSNALNINTLNCQLHWLKVISAWSPNSGSISLPKQSTFSNSFIFAPSKNYQPSPTGINYKNSLIWKFDASGLSVLK